MSRVSFAVENASLAPQLSSGMKTPLFAAEGVTVANTKTKSTPGKYFAKAHEKYVLLHYKGADGGFCPSALLSRWLLGTHFKPFCNYAWCGNVFSST